MEDTIQMECQELKNIKYKFFNTANAIIQDSSLTPSNSISNLDIYLENERNNNVNEPWCKLNKSLKTQKIQCYVETVYKLKNELDDAETISLVDFLNDCVERKKLQRVKDVIYDKKTGIIKDIPALCYVKTTKHFTLKNIDKRVSTLKSLPPKKMQGTIRKKTEHSDSDEN